MKFFLVLVILMISRSQALLLDNLTTKPPVTGHPTIDVLPHDCQDFLWSGYTKSGIYTVYPKGSGALKVFCDQTTAEGGWTLIQRRTDGSEDFFRNWIDYKYGFGNISNEFWIGNHRIHEITSQGYYELRIDLEDFNGNKRQATYRRFAVGDENSGYMLTVKDYTGNAGDSLSKATPNSVHSHNGAQFYTKDHDNSDGCANQFKGGWWYVNCHRSNLNGLYLSGTHSSFADGIEWYTWHGYNYSLKRTEMKIRRL